MIWATVVGEKLFSRMKNSKISHYDNYAVCFYYPFEYQYVNVGFANRKSDFRFAKKLVKYLDI